MEVRFFGNFEAVEGGVPLPVRGAKQRTVLALLALHRGNPVSTDRLIDALWGDEQVANPVNALQAQIGQLRRTLGATAIVTSDAGYALGIGPDDVDASRFERAVNRGRLLFDEGEMALASTALGDALRLRRGEPLIEFAYAGFADAERAHLAELTLVAIETRVEADLALGRHRELIGELEALCRENPLRERVRELLMLALYRAGRQAEALRTYSEVRECLVGELGIDPGPTLRELEARILAHDPSLAAAGPAGLGAVPTPMATDNLREPLSSFVGRAAELEELGEAVRTSRLVTLIGPGGVGKTRLAVEAAATLRQEHRDGAWLVELASVTEPEGVAPAVAGALGAAAAGLIGPPSQDSTVELIVRYLAGRSLLIVLDNCEHVIDQAAALAESLVGRLPDLRLIATSREPLGVPGEVLVPVGPLAVSAAVELFVDRARAVRPGFISDDHTRPVINDICGRLDGLPLAVELAATRLRSLALATLAERLDDRFRLLTVGARTALPRQQTLRAVVDWSYDLLFEDERRLFARLSVFAGGCDLDAAEAICADDQVPTGEILDLLSRLVDKSLVATPNAGRDGRFTQLQTLWRYGRDRLDEAGEVDAICGRHAAHYRQMAEEGHDGLRGASGPIWRQRLTSELGNLRAALDWFIARGDADEALSLASGMAWLWFINSDYVEGARWLGDALGAKGSRSPELAATAQVWHGYFVSLGFSPVTGALECEAAVAALTPSDDGFRRAEALVLCATVLMRAHEFERSLDALREANDLLDPAVHGWQLAVHDLIVAWNLALLGRLDDAEPAARSSVERFDAEGEVWYTVDPLSILAGIAEARGDLDRASATYEALLARCRAARQRGYVTFNLFRLAALRSKQGDDDAADDLYQEALASSFNLSVSADAMVGQAAVARRLGDPARARALLDTAGSYYRNLDLPAGQTGVLSGLAWWALGAGRADDATAFAADACQVASAGGDSATQLLADTAAAAVRAFADPTEHNVEVFGALAHQRGKRLSHSSLTSFTDEPDVAALAARLALLTR
jgi:predicted ATPase/DNA-binding SARP family transcriptional activator